MGEMIEKYESKIASLEKEVKSLREEFLTKDALISEQTLRIKEMESQQLLGKKVERMRDEILESMQSEFEALRLQNKQKKKSAIDDELITDLVDKQDDILSKFNLLQKHYKESKEKYALIEESIDGINGKNERYYNATIKK